MDLPAVLGLVRRRWAPIAICLVVGLAGAVAVTRSTPKTYRASATLFVSIPAAGGIQEALQGVQLSSQLIASYAKIATSRPTAAVVSAATGGRFTPEEVRQKISASTEPDTLLISVAATDVDPASARDLANATADALADVIGDLETTSQGGVQARVIDPAVAPNRPIRPRPILDTTLGALLGLGIGVALALALESLDKSITLPDQASAAFGAPVLATLPRQRRLQSEPLIALEGATSSAGEAYRSLRTSIRFLEIDRNLSTILVTSAGAGEGKSTVTANLAIAVAQAGERVIVIDADLRRPRLASLFGLEEGPGLTSVVFGRSTLRDALRPWRGTVSVLPPGPLPPNPSEVLGSEAMANVLREAAELADVVLIDAPPLLPVTDAAVLSTLVDGTVVVARWARTETSDAEEARFTLEGVGASVVGVVLNAVRGRRAPGYYREYDEKRRSRQGE